MGSAFKPMASVSNILLSSIFTIFIIAFFDYTKISSLELLNYDKYLTNK